MARASALVLERLLRLVLELLLQVLQPRVDDRRIVEIGVLRLARELELHDRRLEIALPRVVLALVLVLLELLVLRRVLARRDEMQLAVARRARSRMKPSSFGSWCRPIAAWMSIMLYL